MQAIGYAAYMNQATPISVTRFWLAVAAYILPTFPLGYVWHLVLFQQQYHDLQLYRADVIIPLGLASMLVQSLVFAWLYPRVFSTRREAWISSATRFFVLFAALAWSFTTLPVAAKYQMTSISMFLALETSFTLVHFLVVSPLIALVYRENN
jgi:hypothetical protein